MNEDKGEKKVIEPEIVNENEPKKRFDSFEDVSSFAQQFAEDEIRGVKNKILLQGFLYLFVIGVILILIIWGIAELLSFILPPLFVLFIILGILFAIGYPIYWLIKKFK